MAQYNSPSDEKWRIYLLKSLLPWLSCSVLLLLSFSLPWITSLEGMSILLPFLGIYYWSVNGYPYFHPIMPLFLGFWLDLILFHYIGLYAMLFILCYIICNGIRRRLWVNSLLIILAGFVAFACIPIFIHLIITKTQGNIANIHELFLSLAIISVLYILFHGLFNLMRHNFW